jgi:hypothetical protein
VAALVAVLILLFAPAPARAECPNIPPWPALTEFGRSAREIVVGTVVGGGGSTFLEFRVDRVLRGDGKVGEVRKLENLLPNWPPGSCTYLLTDEGEVIALGFDALAPDRRTRLNAAAWLKGSPDHYHIGGHAEVATLAEIEAVAAMPPTSTAPETSAAASSRLPGAVVVMIAVVGFLTMMRRSLSRPA